MLRAFPNHFVYNSVYAHYPFTTSSETKVILEKLDQADLYSWEQPTPKKELVIIKSYKAITQILDNQKDFKVTWGDAIRYLVSQPGKPFGGDFCLAGDEAANTHNRAVVKKGLYPTAWEKEIWNFYAEVVPKLFEKYSYPTSGTGSGHEADIVRDIINLANARLNAALFSLPIKTEESPRGIFTEQELYMLLTVLFSAIFFDGDIANSFKLRNAARELAGQLGQIVLLNCQAVATSGAIADVVSKLETGGGARLKDYGVHLIKRLVEKGKSVEEVCWTTVMPLITSNVANQSQVLSQCLDYYIGDGAEHLPELYRLAHENTPEADELLMH